MRVFSIASFVVFLLVTILLIVSFATPWYHVTFKGDDIISFRAQTLKIGTTTDSYKDWETDGDKYYKLIQASIAFAAIAFIFSIAMVILSALDAIGTKLGFLFVGKFLGFVVFLTTFLSFVIYTGMPKQFRKDLGEDTSMFLSGFGSDSFIKKDGDYKQGPDVGWNVVISSCFISLAISIFNVIFFNKSVE